MKPFMQPGRGTPSPRPAGPRVGGLSMAFSGDGSGKKRGLASLNASAPADALAAAYGGTDSGSQQQQQQQLAQQKQSPQQQQQHSKLPVGGLSTHFGSGQFSVGSCAATEDNFLQHLDSGFAAHSPAPSPLSPLSEALQLGPGSAQRSPLSDALAIASCPRRKVPRRQPASAATSATAVSLTAAVGGDSDDGEGVEFPMRAAAVHNADALRNTPPGWAISCAPPHPMASTPHGVGAAVMSLPHGPASPVFGDFRPGSVYEGAGRKLRGTEAMRIRNAVLRQTGFLEPHTDNMFADHTTGGTPPREQLSTFVS